MAKCSTFGQISISWKMGDPIIIPDQMPPSNIYKTKKRGRPVGTTNEKKGGSVRRKSQQSIISYAIICGRLNMQTHQ